MRLANIKKLLGKLTKKRDFEKTKGRGGFLDEYENLNSESSSDESNCDGSSKDEPSPEEEDLVVENTKGDNTFEGLGDNDGGVQWEVKSALSSQPGDKMQVGTFDGCEEVVLRQHKNVRDDGKES